MPAHKITSLDQLTPELRAYLRKFHAGWLQRVAAKLKRHESHASKIYRGIQKPTKREVRIILDSVSATLNGPQRLHAEISREKTPQGRENVRQAQYKRHREAREAREALAQKTRLEAPA